jgi:hypothetical protein
MDDNNDHRKDIEKTTDLQSNFSSASKMGRKGDPRMNRAVAARLANPGLLLSEALRIGGFEYPSDDDSNTVDVEKVSLAQRKNQLSRRIRMARQQQMQEKMQQFFPNPKMSYSLIDLPTRYSLQLQQIVANANMNASGLAAPSNDRDVDGAKERENPQALQSCVSGIPDMKVSEESYTVDQWNTSNQIWSHPAEVSAKSTSYHESATSTAAAKNIADEVKFATQVGDDNHSSPFQYTTLLQQLLNSSSGTSSTNGRDGFKQETQSKRSYADFVSDQSQNRESSHIENQNTYGPIDSRNTDHDSLGIVSGLEESMISSNYENTSTSTNFSSRETPNQDLALRLFETQSKDLYKRCMRGAGYSTESVEGEESSQDYCHFVLAAWIQQGQYLHSIMTEEMKQYMSQIIIQSTTPVPEQQQGNLSGTYPSYSQEGSNFTSTTTVPSNQGPSNGPTAFLQSTMPVINANMIPNTNNQVVSALTSPPSHRIILDGDFAISHTGPSQQNTDLQNNIGSQITLPKRSFAVLPKRQHDELKPRAVGSYADIPFHAIDWNQPDFNDDESEAIMQVFNGN